MILLLSEAGSRESEGFAFYRLQSSGFGLISSKYVKVVLNVSLSIQLPIFIFIFVALIKTYQL
jgi:hypothetical protein